MESINVNYGMKEHFLGIIAPGQTIRSWRIDDVQNAAIASTFLHRRPFPRARGKEPSRSKFVGWGDAGTPTAFRIRKFVGWGDAGTPTTPPWIPACAGMTGIAAVAHARVIWRGSLLGFTGSPQPTADAECNKL